MLLRTTFARRSRAGLTIPGGTLALALVLGACQAGPGASQAPSQAPTQGASASASTQATSSLEPTPAATPVDASVAAGLAFVREVDGLAQLFVIDPDGSARQVGGTGEHASVGAAQPLWSPDRSMIAFGPPKVGSGLDPQLWIINADGTGQRPMGTLGEWTDWSPDSSRLVWTDSVFTTDNTGEPARIWVADVASGDVSQLSPRGNFTRWLADGERISYMPYEQGTDQPRVMVMAVAGGEPQDLIEGVGAWWSPDGAWLLVERDDGIYLADADGQNARLLLEGVASPAWSPDGTRVAFVDVDDAGAFIVGVATREGEILWEGTPGIDPAWSPDGDHLAVDLTISEPLIGILDAATGEQVWELEGRYPDW